MQPITLREATNRCGSIFVTRAWRGYSQGSFHNTWEVRSYDSQGWS
jgi:hypothetical protein